MTTGTSTDPGYALSGAQISFTGGTLLGGNGITAGKPSDVVASGTLTPGVATKLVSAAKNEGAGTWLYNFGDVDVMMQVQLIQPIPQIILKWRQNQQLVWLFLQV